MALRDYKYEYDEEVQTPVVVETSSYEDYQETDEHGQKLKDLLFFLNIAIFSVVAVLATFIFLSLKMNSVLAICLAIPVGLIALQGFRISLKHAQKNKGTTPSQRSK